jgi:hypothetical protein
MSIPDDLERLTQLHAEGALTDEEFAQAKSRLLSAPSTAMLVDCRAGIRRRSATTILGLPLWDIASGPDLETGELRGHACGIIAVGDVATGLIAVGGFARGIIALGGMAIGLVAFGGGAIGVFLAIGGAAIGSVALGGGAIGGIAAGGAAIGYYAVGGAALGAHVISADRQDPAAVAFFQDNFRWLLKLLKL